MKLFILTAITIGSHLLVAASDDVRVLSMRGQVTARVGGKELPLTSGSKLPMNARVVIGQGGYTALITSSGAMRELRHLGVHKIDTLFNGKESSSTLSRVAKYVYTNAYENQAATSEAGTVYRTHTVMPYWPPNLIVDTSVITISWFPVRNYTGAYEFTIRDDSDSVLFTTKLADTTIGIDVGSIAASYRGRCVYWTVQLEKDVATSSNPRCITLASKDDLQDLSIQMQELQSICESHQENSSGDMCRVLIGALYEEQGFYDRACKEYSSQTRGESRAVAEILLQNCLRRGREQ